VTVSHNLYSAKNNEAVLSDISTILDCCIKLPVVGKGKRVLNESVAAGNISFVCQDHVQLL
jgi:hypothetical protein